MPQRVEDRLRPITPQLAWRVAVLGGIAFVLFGIVFFRLWYLQVLTGEEARVSASQNGRRTEKIEAPRGDIVDRNGVPLVQHQAGGGRAARALDAARGGARPGRGVPQAGRGGRARAPARRRVLQGVPAPARRRRPQEATKAEKARAAQAAQASASAARTVADPGDPGDPGARRTSTGASPRSSTSRQKTIHERVIRGIADTPYSNVTIRTDVPPAQFNYMRERPEYFTGIVVTKRNLRRYPQGRARRAAVRDGLGDHRRAAQLRRRALQGHRGRARGSARAGWSGSTTTSCAARTASRASSSTPSAAATSSARSR